MIDVMNIIDISDKELLSNSRIKNMKILDWRRILQF